MSWGNQEHGQNKLTTEEKEKLKVLQQRKNSLIGKYHNHTQIKSQTTTHETWLNIHHKQYKEKNSKIEKLYLIDIELKGIGLEKIILAYFIIQMRF